LHGESVMEVVQKGDEYFNQIDAIFTEL